jgi:hypothetical protein
MIRHANGHELRILTSRSHERMMADEALRAEEARGRFAEAMAEEERRRERRRVLTVALAVLGAFAVLWLGSAP